MTKTITRAAALLAMFVTGVFAVLAFGAGSAGAAPYPTDTVTVTPSGVTSQPSNGVSDASSTRGSDPADPSNGVDASSDSNGAAGSGSDGDNGGTAYTGAAVVGVGVLGLALVAGGAIMLFAGRKRRHA